MTENSVSITIQIPALRLWESVLGAVPTSFGSWWQKFTYLSGDWDEVGVIEYEIDDPMRGEGEGGKKGKITLDDLARGYQIVCERYNHLSDLDGQDSISSDAILQCAVFGEIIYG
jgi:hypothetical protein